MIETQPLPIFAVRDDIKRVQKGEAPSYSAEDWKKMFGYNNPNQDFRTLEKRLLLDPKTNLASQPEYARNRLGTMVLGVTEDLNNIIDRMAKGTASAEEEKLISNLSIIAISQLKLSKKLHTEFCPAILPMVDTLSQLHPELIPEEVQPKLQKLIAAQSR